MNSFTASTIRPMRSGNRWSALLAIGVCVALPVGAASADDPEPPTAPGKPLYEQRCAGCHDRASDRTPSREILSHNPPAFILNAMREVGRLASPQ